jgi:hypothetical protein
MIETIALIDGSTRSVRFGAPMQSACLSYSLGMSRHASSLSGVAEGEEVDVSRLIEVRAAMHGAAVAFLAEHSDDASLDAAWWDREVHHEEALRAANALLASRNPPREAVGK